IGKNDTGIQMPDNSLSPAIMVINGQLVVCDPNAQVEVYDIEGRNVYADQGRLPQGIYIVKVVTDGDVHIQKIIL
ncbi:MAG: T9SS type A sorting domain-containing protein, partial [Porphyromonas sp.]|uniref:T9SS type A sorting domain-containing protein n=1 Tax=Porphyromonas sp. TaxID=1924944 RepID=UPI002A74E34F